MEDWSSCEDIFFFSWRTWFDFGVEGGIEGWDEVVMMRGGNRGDRERNREGNRTEPGIREQPNNAGAGVECHWVTVTTLLLPCVVHGMLSFSGSVLLHAIHSGERTIVCVVVGSSIIKVVEGEYVNTE